MTVELIDGRAGKPHISGDDLGNFKAGFVGIEGYVLETENKLAATLESANKLTINTGAAIMPTTGRHVRITSPETVTIQSGTQGQKRNDLVVLRTATSSDNTTVETASIVVIKGTPTTGTPTDPSINNGDLKLYRLSLDGISVENPVPLFNVLTPLATLGASVDPKTSDGWTYFKLDSGIVISFGMFSVTTTGSSSWGSVTELTPAFKKALPIQLVSPPLFEMAQAWGAGSGLIGVEVYGDDNDIKTHTRKYQALRPSGADGVPSGRTLYFKVINIGRWK